MVNTTLWLKWPFFGFPVGCCQVWRCTAWHFSAADLRCRRQSETLGTRQCNFFKVWHEFWSDPWGVLKDACQHMKFLDFLDIQNRLWESGEGSEMISRWKTQLNKSIASFDRPALKKPVISQILQPPRGLGPWGMGEAHGLWRFVGFLVLGILIKYH